MGEAAKKMGRPKTPAYRKIKMRYSKIEDKFEQILPKFESSKDREMVLSILEELKETQSNLMRG